MLSAELSTLGPSPIPASVSIRPATCSSGAQPSSASIAALDAPGQADVALCSAIAARAEALVDEMRFDFLYDRRKRIFAIGYRLADAEGPGSPRWQLSTICWHRKRDSSASWRSRRATFRSIIGFISAVRSPAFTAAPRSSRGAGRCSSI